MMRRTLSKNSLLAFSLFLTSCARLMPGAGIQDVQTIVSDRIDQNIQWNQNSEDEAKVGVVVSEMLKGELTCEEAVQIALLNNPKLQATYEKLGIAQADLVQAGLLRNPVFDAEVHFVGGGIGTGTNLNIFQDFIDLFQWPLRKRIASSAFESTKLDVANSVLEVASEVKHIFVLLQGAEEMLNLRRTIVEGLSASFEVTKRQHQAGNITDLDIAAENSIYARAKLELSQAQLDVAQEKEKLNLLLGLWGNDTVWEVSSRLPDLPNEEISPKGLETLAVSNRLDLQAAKHEVEALGQRLGLVEAYRLIPEFTLGIDIEGEGKSSIVAGPNFQFLLPIFDQGQARIAGAEATLREAQKRYIALALQIRSEVRTARNSMLAARARAEYAKKTLLPISQQVVQQTQLEYNAMLVGVYNLISAKKEEIEAGSTYVASLKEYWIAKSALEKAVGGSFQMATED